MHTIPFDTYRPDPAHPDNTQRLPLRVVRERIILQPDV